MCIRIDISNLKTKSKNNKKIKKETKEEKRIISVENLMGYDIICEFTLCNFNLPDRVFIFSLISFYLQMQISYNRYMHLQHGT